MNREAKIWIGIALITVFELALRGVAYAGCDQFYPLAQKIEVPGAVELCNTFYVTAYDPIEHEPLFSAERFRAGGGIERSNNFHLDARLDRSTRAAVSDYLHSGYDQGHLVPAGDATTVEEMRDTFLLSNMTPQEPTVNRQSWRVMEMHVRALDPDYIVTGAIYLDKPATIGVHHVPVPTGYYKIVYKSGVITGYCANNQPNAPVIGCDVADVEKASGLTFPRYGE